MVVPLLGGHHGANALAVRLAEVLGATAALTTASDVTLRVPLDAPPPGWRLRGRRRLQARRGGAAVRCAGAHRRGIGPVAGLAAGPAAGGRCADRHSGQRSRRCARPIWSTRRRPSCSASAASGWRRRPKSGLWSWSRSPRRTSRKEAVACVASIALKAAEPAIHGVARRLGVPARFFDAARLERETPRLKNPSDLVFRETGCHGVAEGAALAGVGAEGDLVLPKQRSQRATCAIARSAEIVDPHFVGRARGSLAIVGIGPGAAAARTPRGRGRDQQGDRPGRLQALSRSAGAAGRAQGAARL